MMTSEEFVSAVILAREMRKQKNEQGNPTSYPLPEHDQPAGPQGRKVGKLVGCFVPSANPAFSDPIKPDHYNDTTITVLMVIDDWEANFRAGNALKYLARYQKKGSPVQDLRKAAEYINLEIERLEAQV